MLALLMAERRGRCQDYVGIKCQSQQKTKLIHAETLQIQNTEILLSMNNRNLPYDCIKDTSNITHGIIHNT